MALALVGPLFLPGILTAAGWGPYYTYTGRLRVEGTIGPMETTESTTGFSQRFYFSLEGVDPLCSSGPGAYNNSCGIHLHRGTSCQANPPSTLWNQELGDSSSRTVLRDGNLVQDRGPHQML